MHLDQLPCAFYDQYELLAVEGVRTWASPSMRRKDQSSPHIIIRNTVSSPLSTTKGNMYYLFVFIVFSIPSWQVTAEI